MALSGVVVSLARSCHVERGGGCGRGGAVGGDPPLVFREAVVDQGDRPAQRPRAQHDSAGAALARGASVSAAAAAVEARLVPRGGAPAAAQRSAPAGQAGARAARGAGLCGSKAILDDYLREVRPLFLPRPRTSQRTSYRPGALCQFDLWEPSREIPVGCGQTRRGYVVVGCLPYSRAGAATLVFSKEAPDLLYGIGRCLVRLGGLPETLVQARDGRRLCA